MHARQGQESMTDRSTWFALLCCCATAAAQQPINASAWMGLPYALSLLEEGACTRQPGICESVPAEVSLRKARANDRTEPPCVNMCRHGCYTLPRLVKRRANTLPSG